MFSWLYNILGAMLAWFESWTGTYAIALLFYALIFKVLFLPFGIKQQKNQIAMAKLAPKIELIKAKYRGRTDRPTLQKQQMEIMELQKSEGYSAFSGCLPLLIQLPLIILLYNVIQHPLSYIADYNTKTVDVAITEVVKENKENLADLSDDEKIDYVLAEIYNDINHDKIAASTEKKDGKYKEQTAETIGTAQIGLIDDINSLSKDKKTALEAKYGIIVNTIPNFELFGVNLAKEPGLKKESFSILVIIPVLAAVMQWLSMWITRKLNSNPFAAAQDSQAQASMRIMDLVMPIMTLFLAFNFSGMLGIYWVYQSGFGILQTVVLAKVMPLPKYTPEELKAMRKAQKEAEKAQKAAMKEQPRYKSLHYIDDEDYDELPEVKTNNENQTDKKMGNDIPEIKD